MRARAQGFSLVDLMAGLAIAAILAGWAVPSFTAALSAHRAAAAVSELRTALAMARLASVARNEPAVVCPSADGERCTGEVDWTVGWIVFADRDHLGAPAAADAMLLRHAPIATTMRLRSSAGRSYVRFHPSGWASGTNLSVSACASGVPGLRLVMNNAGRTRVERVSAACSAT